MKVQIKNKIKKNKFFIFVFSILLGVISSFALPPYNHFIINFFVYPLIFIFCIFLNGNKKYLFICGLLFGFGYFFSNLYWISNSLKFDDTFKFLIPVSLILIPLFLSIFYGISFLVLSFFRLNYNFSSILYFASIISFFEYLRGTILTGFPWNITAFSLSELTYSIQILSLIGTYSLNLLVITLFVLPSLILFNINIKIKILLLLTIFIAVITNNIYGFKRIENFSHVKNQVLDSKIVIVSPKIQLNRYFSNENPINKIDEIIKISRPETNIKTMFIFPEGILSGIYLEDLNNYKNIFYENFSENHKIILGINRTENFKIFNSLVLLNNKLDILAKYDKNNLVPFGEFLPFEDFLSKLGLKKITQGYNSFSNSIKREFISVGKYKFLPLICYEIIYTGKLNKKSKDFDYIVNISEDGWFGNSIGPEQHFSHSIFRAIEEGKNLYRSSNNGISAHINPIGKIEDKIKSTQSGVIEVENARFIKKTIFSEQGNKIFFYFLLIYITFASFLKRKDL